MRRLSWPALLGLAAVALVGGRRRPVRSATERDVTDLARMLVVEAGEGGSSDERVGMARTALRRAQLYGATVGQVIRSEVAGRAEWGAGCGSNPQCEYHRRLALAPQSSGWARAVQDAIEAVRQGPESWGFLSFVHPRHSGFDRPGGRRVYDPPTGQYLPRWAVAIEHGGTSPLVTTIGSFPTRFAA